MTVSPSRIAVGRSLSGPRGRPAIRTAAMLAGLALVLATVPSGLAGAVEKVGGCGAVDGDTIRCGALRVRLLGIDAPELPGHCRPGRRCAPGNPHASTASLQEALASSMAIRVVGLDRYGRTLATVSAHGHDLSCHQLRQGQAIYKPRWDDGGRVAAACPKLTV